ncbi:hypothetical protein [Deinococcus sp.]|uniref:hypothetical protein n=1 Tax=Deinococcus sp. TaxID=47478 RepID=UPI0025BCACD0|nr:hypothetical protein [Deinococcus sp.]
MTEPTIQITAAQWQALQEQLYERDHRLAFRVEGQHYRRDETVDAYTLSAHAEALQSGEVDGDLWGTLEDIDETADSEEDAWNKIKAFYFSRGCVLLRVTGTDEPEEWILTSELARHLKLLA